MTTTETVLRVLRVKDTSSQRETEIQALPVPDTNMHQFVYDNADYVVTADNRIMKVFKYSAGFNRKRRLQPVTWLRVAQ